MEHVERFTDDEVQVFPIERLANVYHIEFTKDVVKVAKSTEILMEKMPELVNNLEEAYEQEFDVMQKEMPSETVEQLNEKVEKRGKVQTAVKAGLRANIDMPDPEQSAIAQTLLKLAHDYDIHANRTLKPHNPKPNNPKKGCAVRILF